MIPDLISYGLAGLLLAFAFVKRAGLAASIALCLSLAIDRTMLNAVIDGIDLLTWAIILSCKDYAFIWLFGIRHEIKELPILVSFSISCLLHQIILIEVYNRDLTLFYLRPDIMSVLVSAMLASIIYIQLTGGGKNGGKRVLDYRVSNHHRLFNLLYIQAFKATK